MTSDLQKSFIFNGQDSLAAFRDGGVVYRASDIENYTPIVFKNIRANTAHYFDLQSVISKDYRVMELFSDLTEDDELDATATAEAIQLTYSSVFISTYKNNKRQSFRQISPGGGSLSSFVFLLSPLDKLSIFSDRSANSITLYCQPIYLENTIVVPEEI